MPSGVFDLYQLFGSAQQANQKTASCFGTCLWGYLQLYRNGLITAVVVLNRAQYDSRQLAGIPKSAPIPRTLVARDPCSHATCSSSASGTRTASAPQGALANFPA